jgi:hypothetical protein
MPAASYAYLIQSSESQTLRKWAADGRLVNKRRSETGDPAASFEELLVAFSIKTVVSRTKRFIQKE